MKALILAPVVLLAPFALLTGVAALFSGDLAYPTSCIALADSDMSAILKTIRIVESGDNYRAQAPKSSASGAYQFTRATWNNHGGYRNAVDAPPEIQDDKAIAHVTAILEQTGGDHTIIGPVWYIGHVPTPTEWDTVPYPSAGNVLTPRQYQTKWMKIYQTYAPSVSESSAPESDTAEDNPTNHSPANDSPAADLADRCSPSAIPAEDGWALPGPPDQLTAAQLSAPHHDYPAWDWPTPAGTPIYAIRGGTITGITNFAHNWYTYGCQTSRTRACNACGIGVIITDTDANTWTYCHGTTHTTAVQPGRTIRAGTQIMTSGNTGRSRGRSGGYHLHVAIKAGGKPRCPQPLLRAIFAGTAVPAPATLTAKGCTT